MAPTYPPTIHSDCILIKDSAARVDLLCNVAEPVPLGICGDHIADTKDEAALAAVANHQVVNKPAKLLFG